MGKGRNRRHCKKQRDKKRPVADVCPCGRRGSHLCKTVVKELREKKSAELDRHFDRKRKRSEEMTYRAQRTRDYDFVTIGTTHLILFVDNVKSLMNKIHSVIEKGYVVDFYILAYGTWNRRAKRYLQDYLRRLDLEWLNNHLVFQLRAEDLNDFVLRATSVYEMTHFFDANTYGAIKEIALSNEHTSIKLHDYSSPDAFVSWLRNTYPPKFIRPVGREEDAFSIIEIPTEEEVSA